MTRAETGSMMKSISMQPKTQASTSKAKMQTLKLHKDAAEDVIKFSLRTRSITTRETVSVEESGDHTRVNSAIDTAQRHGNTSAATTPELTDFNGTSLNDKQPNNNTASGLSTQRTRAAVYRWRLPQGFSYADVAQARAVSEDAYDADDEDEDDADDDGSDASSFCGRECRGTSRAIGCTEASGGSSSHGDGNERESNKDDTTRKNQAV